MKKLLVILSLFFLLIAAAPAVQAQCAMCTATVESSSNEGSSATKGLNAGILYMLAAPYLAVMAIGILWYKKYRNKKNNVVVDMPEKEINLN